MKTINLTLKRGFFTLMLLLIIGQKAQSQNLTIPPELKNLINHALDSSYLLANERIDIKETAIQKAQVLESYLPRIDAVGMYAVGDADLTTNLPKLTSMILSLPSLGDMTFENDAKLTVGSVNAKMLLFSGLKVPYATKALAEKKKAQEVMVEKDESDIVAEVIRTYDLLAILQQSDSVIAESTRRLEMEKKTAAKALENGLMVPFDMKKIEIAILTLDSKKIEIAGGRTMVYQKLAQLTHLPIDSLRKLHTQLTPWLINSSKESIDNRPELRALDFAILAGKYKMRSEQFYWLPKIQAMGSYGYYGLNDIHIATPLYNAQLKSDISLDVNKAVLPSVWYVGIGLKWELFDGFHAHHNVQLARLEMDKNINNRQNASTMLNLNLQKAKVDMQVSAQQLILKEKQIDYGKSNLELAIKGYREGLVTIIERIQEETEYQKMQLEYIQAIYNQRQNAVEYLKAMGNLKESIK